MFAANRCANCHSRFRDPDQLYAELLSETNGRDYVEPFEPEESNIIRKIEGSMFRYAGVEMVELMRAWINLGALDN